MTDLQGRHVLVTGAGSGIGAAVAMALADAGAKVSLAGRRRLPLDHIAGLIPSGRALVLESFDVTDPAAIEQGLGVARQHFGPIDILVNNAGEAPTASFEKTDMTLWSHVMATNLTSVYLVTHAVLPDLRKHGPGARIISIASTASLHGYPYVSAYCAAKHGVVGLTRSLALELAKSGVTVNAVCPGFTDTPMIASAIEKVATRTGRSEEAVLDSMVAVNPQGRLVTPKEVADTVLWLASPGASSINGQSIVVAGGEVMAG